MTTPLRNKNHPGHFPLSEKKSSHQCSFITTFVLDQTDQLRLSSNHLSSLIISLRFHLFSSAGYPHRKLCNHNCQNPIKERLPRETRNSTEHFLPSVLSCEYSGTYFIHTFLKSSRVYYKLAPQIPSLMIEKNKTLSIISRVDLSQPPHTIAVRYLWYIILTPDYPFNSIISLSHFEVKISSDFHCTIKKIPVETAYSYIGGSSPAIWEIVAQQTWWEFYFH